MTVKRKEKQQQIYRKEMEQTTKSSLKTDQQHNNKTQKCPGITLKAITFAFASLIQRSFQATAPLSTPTLIVEGKSNDANWNNLVTPAFTTTRKGSRLGNSRYIVYTSFELSTTVGPTITIFDSFSTIVQPSLSGSGLRITNHFASFNGGDNKFAIIDSQSTQTLIKIMNNNLENQPAVLKTMPIMTTLPLGLLYDESTNTLIVGSTDGVYRADTSLDSPTYAKFDNIASTNYYNIIKEGTSGSTFAFTIGNSDKKFQTFDYSATTSALTNEITLTSTGTAISQAKRDTKKLLIGLVYSDNNKNLAYFKDYTTTTLTQEVTFDPDDGLEVDYPYIWAVDDSDYWFTAVGKKVYLVESSDTAIALTDKSSLFLSTADEEILTSLVFFSKNKYLVAAGYKQDSYAFIKKMNFIGDCHSTCKTCSFGGDDTKCLTCPSDRYLYQPDSTTNKCLLGTECQLITDFYTNNSTKKCVSKSDCLTGSRYLVEEYSDCVYSCPSTHEFIKTDSVPTPAVKECLTSTQCQGKSGFNTFNETKTCISDDECKTTKSYVIIGSWSDCVSKCAEDPTNTHLWKGDDNICVTHTVCQDPSAATRTYTKNDTTGFLCTPTCTSPNFKVDYWYDCVSTCANYSPELWENSAGTHCITTEDCKASDYTQIHTQKCVTAEICSSTDSNFIITEDSKSICVEVCGVGLAANYNYKFTDPTPSSADATFNTCYSANGCKTANYFRKHDTFECLTDDQCSADGPGGKAWYLINDGKNDCIERCPEHKDGTHILEDKTAAKRTCVTEANCNTAGNFIDKVLEVCVSKTQCDTALKYTDETQCRITCAEIGEYGSTVDKVCKTAAECIAIPDGASTYLVKESDNQCVTTAECTSDNHFEAVGDKKCLENCDIESTTHIYVDATNKKCYDETGCKSIDTKAIFKPDSTCIDVTACISSSFYHIAETSECVEDCLETDYKYFDLADSANRVCKSLATCQTDKFTRDKDFNCVTAAECQTGSMYTTSTRTCVEVCPATEYKLELTGPDWKCVSSTDCIAQTTPTQHYMIDDGIMRCVTDTVCKGSTYNRFLDETNHKCVYNCELKASPKIFTDKTDGKCLTGAECQAVESGGIKIRSTFNETKECLTDTECTGTSVGEYNGFIVNAFRDCVRQCGDAYPDHSYIDKSDPKKCLSATECTAAGKYLREDTKYCVTADECKTDLMFTTSTNYCVSTCPSGEYKLELSTAFKCITAALCEAEVTGGQHYKVEDGIKYCVTEATCTGTSTGQYSRFIIKDTKLCVHDCATQSSYPYTDETLKICHSETGCQTFSSTDTTPDRVAMRDAKICLTEATCQGGTYNYKKIIDGTTRLCVESCSEKDTHKYLLGVGGDTCVSQAQCEGNSLYGYIRENKKTCMSKAECYTDSGYIVEATTGDGFGTCSDFCPTGEYKWTDGSTTKECITDAECYGKALNIDDEFDVCYSDADCIAKTKVHMTDVSATPNVKKCLAECPTHGTHKWQDGNTCITGLECQGKTDGFTQNTTYLCVTEATCLSDGMVTIKENNLNDCDINCPSTLYKNAAGNCITATECQVDTPSATYTLNQSQPQNLCITKTECDAFSYLTVEEFNDCRPSCPSNTESLEYLTYTTTKTCLSEDQCKAIGTHYIFYETSSCIDKTACTAISYYSTDYDVFKCLPSCPSTYYAFNPAGELQCITETDCLAKTAPIYLEKTDFKCVSKTECDALNKLTQTGNNECLAECPDTFYKLDTDKTCIDQAACQAIPRYTLNSSKECIESATCTGASMIVVEEYKDCSCPDTTPYWDMDTNKCLNADQCFLAEKYTFNETKMCITQAQCFALTPTAGHIVEAWNDCVTDCSVPETLNYNLARSTDPEKRCVSSLMCKNFADGYVTDTNNCYLKAECTTNTLKSIEDSRECLSDCANSATHKFTDEVDQSCFTGVGCQQRTDRYTNNDTMKCITRDYCITTETRVVIEDWSDCLATCPNVPGQHRFLDDNTKTCYTGVQCQALTDYYTQNSSLKCIPEATCLGESKKLIKEWSDCIVDCPTHATHTYEYGANECLSSKNCQALPDGFTFNTSTPLTCISAADCIAKPAYTVKDYHDCTTPCPTGYVLDQNQCLTTIECTEKGYFINSADSTCLVACPDPLFHDTTTLTCVSACPSELYTSSTDRKCYTGPACLVLTEDHWIYPGDKTCQAGCSLFKQEASRSCLVQTSCPEKSSSDDSKCYLEVTINNQKADGTVADTENTDKRPTVVRIPTDDADKITLFLRLPIPVSGLENFIDKITYAISSGKIQGRLLQTGDIPNFEFSEGTTAGEYQVKFDSPLTEEFIAKVQMKPNTQVYYKSTTDQYPSLYKIDLTEMTFTIPAAGPRNYTLSEGITMAYDAILKTVPMVGNVISMISTTRLMAFTSDNYNKIVLYSRAKAMNIRDEDFKEIHNFTFADWGSRVNRIIIKKISSKIVSDDIQKVCEKPERQSCINRLSANILINKSLFILVFIILIILISKRRVKFGMLPILWLSNQLFFNFDLVHNITFFDFKGTFHIIGLILSILLSLAVLGLFGKYTADTSQNGENYKMDLFQNLFYQIFKNRKLMGEYIIIKLITGILISIVIASMNPISKVQGIILVVIELAVFITTFRGYFKHSLFNLWNLITSFLFLGLAVLTLILALSSGTSSTFIDKMVYYVSWAIIIVDIIFTIISFRALRYEIDEPYTGIARKEVYEEAKQLPPPFEDPAPRVMVTEKKEENLKKQETHSNKVGKGDNANTFLLNGRTVTYKKNKGNEDALSRTANKNGQPEHMKVNNRNMDQNPNNRNGGKL